MVRFRHPVEMNRAKLVELMRRDNGVATRRELKEIGVSSSALDGRLQSGEWKRVFKGVFLLFSSHPSFRQKLIAILKWSRGTAVFSHNTAAFLHGMLSDPPKVPEIVVGKDSGLTSNSLVTVRRRSGEIPSEGTPPRTTLERTVVDLLNVVTTKAEALDVIIGAVQRGMRGSTFLADAATHKRLRHREFTSQLLEVTDEGVESHLEYEYRRRVERAHGLPRGRRQEWELIRGRWIRSDCRYEDFSVRAELDGELAHPGRATDPDIIRDNDVLLSRGEKTLRYRWPHVPNQPCLVAGQVGSALEAEGWSGRVRKCSPGCTAPDVVVALHAQAV